MKITDPQVIEDGERDLIEAVREDLDLDAVRQILKERMTVSALSAKGGQIVVHNNKIAFRLDFDINLSGSLLFDREGNYIVESEEDDTLAPEMELDGFDTQDNRDYPFSDNIALVETGLNETDLTEQEIDPQEIDEMSINLPYDLEDESEKKMGLSDPDDLDINPLDLETDTLLPEEPDLLTQEPYVTAESNDFTSEDLKLEGLDDEDLDDEDLDLDLEGLNDEGLDEEDLELEGLDDEELELEGLDDEGLDDEELELEDLDLDDSEENDLLQEERLDDDINDILKESREFWEQKKDS